MNRSKVMNGVRLEGKYNLNAPKGVNGRNSDHTKIRQHLGWEPDTRLRDGMQRTLAWIREQFHARRGAQVGAA
jgi:nucleoside-diphosphate-sugar epimerase